MTPLVIGIAVGSIALVVAVIYLAKRYGRYQERATVARKGKEAVERMADAALDRPRNRGELADRLRDRGL